MSERLPTLVCDGCRNRAMDDANTEYKVFRVTMEVDFFFPQFKAGYKGGVSPLNGWTPDELKECWFGERFPNSHAARDGHRVGNSEHILKVEVMDAKEASESRRKSRK